MKTIVSISLLCIASLCVISCKDKGLSKEEAVKQINVYINKTPVTVSFKSFFVTNDISNLQSDFPRRLENARKESYLLYETRTITAPWSGEQCNTILITLNDKINPFVVEKKTGFDNYLKINSFDVTLRGGQYESEVTSMTEPAADASGRIVCRVAYASRFYPTAIYYILGDTKNDEMKEAVFVKMQDGWQLDEK